VSLRLLLIPALALLAACDSGSSTAPDMPTYDRDVRPIMLSRCVRCHGAGGTLNADPAMIGTAQGIPIQGYFDAYADRGDCTPSDAGIVPSTCKPGAKTYAPLMAIVIESTGDGRMPPLPAPKLTDRQIEIIKRWAAEMPPLEN
jgi:mono/diheme cytochrome c family protein